MKKLPEQNDFSKLLKGYDKKWVIISKDNTHIIAADEDLEKISNKLDEGVLMLVPDSSTIYAPSIQ